MAVSPSRTYSPERLASESLSLEERRADWLRVRVRQDLSPSTWDPPSRVRMLLTKERICSV